MRVPWDQTWVSRMEVNSLPTELSLWSQPSVLYTYPPPGRARNCMMCWGEIEQLSVLSVVLSLQHSTPHQPVSKSSLGIFEMWARYSKQTLNWFNPSTITLQPQDPGRCGSQRAVKGKRKRLRRSWCSRLRTICITAVVLGNCCVTLSFCTPGLNPALSAKLLVQRLYMAMYFYKEIKKVKTNKAHLKVTRTTLVNSHALGSGKVLE